MAKESSIVTGIFCKKSRVPSKFPSLGGFAYGFLLALSVALAMLTAPSAAVADPARGRLAMDSPDSRYLETEPPALDRQTAFIHIASQYAGAVLGGLVVGGLLMNHLTGGLSATIVGGLVGLSIAGLLYLNQASGKYAVHERR